MTAASLPEPRRARPIRRAGALLRASLLAGAGVCATLLAPAAFAQRPEVCPPTAQAPTPDELKALAASARDHGFLWRIVKDGRSSYLYGTVHVAQRDWALPGPTIRGALIASDTIALELDAADPEILRRLAVVMRAAPDDTPLPEALRTRLQRRAEAECLPAGMLDGLAPEVQIGLLTSIVGRTDGLDPAYGIDGTLGGLGHGAGKTVVSLETPELQLATLKMADAAQTLAFVENGLADLESGRAGPQLRRIAQIWADADFDALGNYESWCECERTELDRALMVRMLDERNPAMADSVAALHDDGHTVFAAVGSLHMVGPKGLPALMAERGYTVERVTLAR